MKAIFIGKWKKKKKKIKGKKERTKLLKKVDR